MNPRKPYRPGRRAAVPGAGSPEPPGGPGCSWALMLLPLMALGAVAWWRLRPAAPVNATPAPSPAAATEAAPTPLAPEPTSTFFLPPAPSPTAVMTPVPTQLYTTQSGDTLPALAARFGVNPADIKAPQGLAGRTTLKEGQLLVIPRALAQTGPGQKLIPDSELVYSGGGAGFNPGDFARQQGGFLAGYKGFADGKTRSGGDLVLLVAQHHSVNPRLLMALLEYQSGWVTQAAVSDWARRSPLGRDDPLRSELYPQLTWAATQLATGYYGWRAGNLTELRLADGSLIRLEPTLNAGTVALQYFFSLTLGRAEWEAAVGPGGLPAVYQAFFGDPFARAVAPLIPADLSQPPLRLPFLPGHTWYLTGGPHGAWERGGAMAALDFAPSSFEGGCAESYEVVTAAAAGKVVRSDYGSVLLDLDGDGREATGWVILYLHIAEKGRVAVGQVLEAGDSIGHPSCEGGQSTGTHVHLARKFNGEWILADGVVPFDLSGWVAASGKGEYFGSLTRDGQTVEACTCAAAYTGITADR